MEKFGRLIASAVVLVGSGLAAWPAAADRDWDNRRSDHRRHGDDRNHGSKDKRPIIIYEGRPMYIVPGPPDWAPAHGYRRKQNQYATPFALTQGRCDRDELGQILGIVAGGVAGGLVGTQIGRGSGNTAAIIGGTIAGALVGGSIGRGMDMIDQSCVGQSLEYAPAGRPFIWQNPDRGRQYQVVPTQTYQDRVGRYCREYTTQVLVGGLRQEAYGLACRQPDGAWEVVS